MPMRPRLASLLLALAALIAWQAPAAGQDVRLQVESDISSCDQDGVRVGFTVKHGPGSASGPRVTHVNVTDIATACTNGVLSVVLSEGASALASGELSSIAGHSGSVELSPYPLAQRVDRVGVSILKAAVIDPTPSAEPTVVVPSITPPYSPSPSAEPELPVKIPARCKTMALENLIVGTAGDDSFLGTELSDLITGGSGGRNKLTGLGRDDCLVGASEIDVLIGRTGPDRLLGRKGHDKLYGGRGHDLLYGGRGMDRISAGAGRDLVFGGRGHDRVRGKGGNDSLLGKRGNDILRGGRGADLLLGGAGNDVLYGGRGRDMLVGGRGYDICVVRDRDRTRGCERVVRR